MSFENFINYITTTTKVKNVFIPPENSLLPLCIRPPTLTTSSPVSFSLHRPTSLYRASFYCTSDTILQFEDSWQPCIQQVYRCHSSNSMCSLLSLCHILVILTTFQTSPFLFYLLIHNVTVVTVLGHQKPCPIARWISLINTVFWLFCQ